MTDPSLTSSAARRSVATWLRSWRAITPSFTEVLLPDAVTRWPQSGERMTSAMSCILVRENYPGGPPSYGVPRILGGGDVWVAEMVADYSDGRWYTVSVFEFEGARIARITDYFGPSLPAPEWRAAWVERDAPEAS